MATNDKTVKVTLVAVAQPYIKGTNEAAAATRKLGRDIDGVSRDSKGLETSTKGAAGSIKGLGAAAGAIAGTALVSFMTDAVQAAGNLEQSIGGVNAVFGDTADQIHAFGEGSADAVGLSTNAFNELVTVTGAMLKNKGLEDFTQKSIDLVKVGADLSATFGGTAKDAVEALNAAMRGESDPIERYGISLNETAVNAELAAKGLDKLEGAALDQAKAQARIDIIMRQSADATGAFAREADTLQGQQQRLTAEWENAKAELGQALLPVLTDVMSALRGGVDVVVAVADAFEKIPGPVKAFAAALVGFRLLRGPVSSFLTGTIEDLRKTRLELDSTTKSVGRTDKAMRLLTAGTVVVGIASVARGLQDAAAAANVADVEVSGLAETLGQISSGGRLSGGIADIFRDEGGLLQAKEQFVGATEAIDRFATVAFDALSDSNYSKVIRFLQPGAEATLEKYITQIDQALAQMVAGGNIDGAQAALDSLLSGIDDPQVAEAARRRFVLFGEAVKGSGDEAKDAAPKVDTYAQQTQDLADKTQKAADLQKQLARAILDVSDAAVSADQAEADWQAAIDNATAALDENGRTATKSKQALDLTTEAGRNNQDALIAMRDAALANAEAMLQQGDETSKVKGKIEDAREEFIRVAEKMGLSKDAAKRMADEYGLTKGKVDNLKTAMDKIPEEVKSKVEMDTAAALRELAILKGALNENLDKTVTIRTRYVGSAGTSGIGTAKYGKGPLEFADGGHVSGAGTATSDSIPAWLSNGEYVVKAAAVDKYGKHFLDNLNAMRFADGGFVSRMQPSPSMDLDRLAAMISSGGSGLTVNVAGADPHRAAREVIDAWQWEVAR